MTHKMIVLVGALMLVASACAAGDGTTQAGEPSVLAMSPTTAVPSVDAGSDSTGQAAEGIQVHGHWTIEVRNPDGSVAEHREFENALTEMGAELLAQLLNNEVEVNGGAWVVSFDPNSCASGNLESYVVATPTTRKGGYLSLEGGGVPSLLFTGDPLPPSYELASVMTIAGTTETDDSSAWGFSTLTCKDIAPLTIQPDQSVYVTVEISFS